MDYICVFLNSNLEWSSSTYITFCICQLLCLVLFNPLSPGSCNVYSSMVLWKAFTPWWLHERSAIKKSMSGTYFPKYFGFFSPIAMNIRVVNIIITGIIIIMTILTILIRTWIYSIPNIREKGKHIWEVWVVIHSKTIYNGIIYE